MDVFLASTILLIIQNSHASTDFDLRWSIQEDLKTLNETCSYGTCLEGRTNDTLSFYDCQCGAICAQYGTCCIDSPYSAITPPRFRPTCRSLNIERSYYMVDRCSSGSPWKVLCEEEWNGNNDVMTFVPVTSLLTLITYKNYFCFRCYEANDDFRRWNIELESDDELGKFIGENQSVSLTYNRHNYSWEAPLGHGGSLVTVSLNIKGPPEIESLPVGCDSELISHCSDAWSDEDTRKKCEAYMGVMYIERSDSLYKYRNMHCALCNFESVEKLSCKEDVTELKSDKIPFSIALLFDINRSDGDLVGKIERCKSTHLWDPFKENCIEVTCALPGYVVRNGKCAAS